MWRRSPVVAGSFYPSSREKLRGDIEGYLNDVESGEYDGEILGLIVPHAGYIYSGPIAAYAFSQLKNSAVELVIALAPSHRARFDGASVIPDGIYETPLGDVPIDSTIGNELLEKNRFTFTKQVHMAEHSLEVQVPFMQEVLGEFTLVPVIVGTTDLVICEEIARGISDTLKNEERSFVIVISTDLSHYYPYKEAQSIDTNFIDNLVTFDEKVLASALKTNKAQACGEGAVLTGLSLLKSLGAHSVEVLKYATSGDTAGDKNQVVGYLAAALMR